MNTLPEVTGAIVNVQEELAATLATIITLQDSLTEMITVVNTAHDWTGGHSAYMAGQGLNAEPADHATTELETLRERLRAAHDEAETLNTTALAAANSAAEDAELALAEMGSE